MLARVYSGAVYGVDAYAVEIEVNAGFGDPSVVIVGLPDAAVRESKDRVSSAETTMSYTHVRRSLSGVIVRTLDLCGMGDKRQQFSLWHQNALRRHYKRPRIGKKPFVVCP